MKNTDKKALVLNSGGVDSTTCVALAIEKYGKENVITASLYYGQKHDKELKAAQQIADYYGVRHIEEDISNVMKYAGEVCSLVKGSKDDIVDMSYADQINQNGEGRVGTYVPFRNGLFLSYATALALQFGCSYVVYGAHSDDSNVTVKTDSGEMVKCQAYPDCTSQFIEAMSEAISQGTGGVVKLVAPIYSLTKSEVAQLGVSLGMSKEDFKHTWSCYEGGSKECGTCGTCRDKIKALRSINFTDEDLKEMFEEVL